MGMNRTWVRIGGVPATEIAPHTPPTWETGADGGCLTASVAFSLPGRSQHQALRAGNLFEILVGPVPIWRGLLSEPDRSTWECHAYGLSTALQDHLALDPGTSATTRNLGDAISRAIANGWPGRNPTSIAGTAAGDADGNPVSVATLLSDYAEQTGQRWGVDGYGNLYMRPDPVAPQWLAAPEAVVFGTTDEGLAGSYAGRYFDGTTHATALVGTGTPEVAVDLTDRETLTETAAVAILTGMLQRTGKLAWTNGTTLTREQLTTVGGEFASLLGVRGGHMMRAHGLPYGLVAQALRLDFVIGKTRYTDGAAEIYVEAVNTAPRTLPNVLAAS